MSRRNRRQSGESRPVSVAGATRREAFRGVDHLVRSVPGASAAKAYRCPGCRQEIPAGRPHVVAWPDQVNGAGERRHWHTACWAARERR